MHAIVNVRVVGISIPNDFKLMRRHYGLRTCLFISCLQGGLTCRFRFTHSIGKVTKCVTDHLFAWCGSVRVCAPVGVKVW